MNHRDKNCKPDDFGHEIDSSTEFSLQFNTRPAVSEDHLEAVIKSAIC